MQWKIILAGLYAMENNIDRLQTDHIHAGQIADALINKDFIGKILPVETNIIIFDVIGERFTAKSFCEKLAEDDILCLPVSSSQVRMVTHLDVTIDMVKKLNNLIAGM